MERPLPSPGAKPSVPRVRTVGFSVYGEADDSPVAEAQYADDSPLPVIIPPAFQVRARTRRRRRRRQRGEGREQP